LTIALAALVGCTGSEQERSASDNEDASVAADVWTTLTLEDFQTFMGEADTWKEADGEIVCSGQPKGYIYSREEYGDFVWEAEYMLIAPEGETDPERIAAANTGFMIHIQEPHKVWPVSLEVQGKHVEMCSIKANGGAAELTIHEDAASRESARKPVGEWNQVQITSRDGALEARLNGELICTSEAGELTSGRIGLQSEGFEVHFRNVRIRETENSTE
jgi:hypothetical protein